MVGMMIRLGLLFLVTTLLVASCGYSPEEAKQFNQSSFSHPEYVGEVQGHKLYRIEIARQGEEKIRNHWVYYFDTNPTVTINMGEHQGKAIVNQVQILVNGKPIFTTNIVEQP
jgi:hypothetical protein